MSKDTRLRELLANVMPSLVKDFPERTDRTPPEPPPLLFTNDASDANPGVVGKKHVRFTVKPSKPQTKPLMVSNAPGIRHVVPLHTPTLEFSLDR